MDRLKEDLKMLAVLDPSLRILELDNGELAMITAGEVHLQKCLKDLEDLGFIDLEIGSIKAMLLDEDLLTGSL
ncbi:hypothetical protein ANCDUO_06089 [Ancylostoma duodenale]|uniref:Elongation Factor G domain-containing protein n=1 Tax=Ancylostoma duodenale TaxID=51022 RepID=A0A0C2GQK6_9BILA|nr:hypothetical protein ANCDUO_06089 [Ancylostoma duodenale]